MNIELFCEGFALCLRTFVALFTTPMDKGEVKL